MIKTLDTKKIALFFLAAIAITMQAQISLFAHEDYLGLRINLADFILPFAGLYALYSLITGKTRWPQWSNKYTPYLLFSLLGILTIALINGYLYIGEWSSWALINKYIGFIILICYFFLAGWLVTNFEHNQILFTFTRFFCGAFIVTLVLGIIDIIQQPYTTFPLLIGNYAWDGFTANRNAYMLVALFAIVSLLTHSLYYKAPLPFWCSSLLWTIMPTFTLYNSSRTGWIFGTVIICAYFIKAPKRFFKDIAPFLAIGTALVFLIFNSISHGEVKKGYQYKYLTAAIYNATTQGKELDYLGDKKRFIALEDGIELYQQSNPIIGAGLGAYKPFQIAKHGKYIDVIDWSSLWLLTETGILGLVGFSAFFLLCLNVFYKRGFKEESPYHTALFFFLILIIAMSFLHELLYTRFLWFALGLGMAANRNLWTAPPAP
jgi:O-antigen ligase